MSTELFPFAGDGDESDSNSDAGSRPADAWPRTAPAESRRAAASDPDDEDDRGDAPGHDVEEPRAQAGTWEGDLELLRARFPGSRDGTLFCVYKLEQDPELNLRDFKAEAALRGVPLNGRSYHGAKVLLGLEAPTPPKPRARRSARDEDDDDDFSFEPAPVAPAPRRTRTAPAADVGGSLGGDLETVIRVAIEQAVEARSEVLRDAIRSAIEVLQSALDESE